MSSYQKEQDDCIRMREVDLETVAVLEEGIQPGGALCGVGCIAAGVWCGFGCPK